MEIKNYSAAVNAYRYNAELASDKPSAKKADKAKGRNTDKAEFSASARANLTESLKASAKNAAESSASPERLRELSASIANGTYNVSSEDIADAILGL